MNHLVAKKNAINRRLDDLRNHPAAKQSDRSEWITLTEPVFAERLEVEKKFDEERSILAGLAASGMVKVVDLCGARECDRAVALSKIILSVVSGMYSDNGVELDRVKAMVAEYKERFVQHIIEVDAIERKLDEAIALECKAVGNQKR